MWGHRPIKMSPADRNKLDEVRDHWSISSPSSQEESQGRQSLSALHMTMLPLGNQLWWRRGTGQHITCWTIRPILKDNLTNYEYQQKKKRGVYPQSPTSESNDEGVPHKPLPMKPKSPVYPPPEVMSPVPARTLTPFPSWWHHQKKCPPVLRIRPSTEWQIAPPQDRCRRPT